MKRNRCFKTLFLFFLNIFLGVAQGEKKFDKETIYSLYDNAIGNENTDLYKGLVYRKLYRTVNEFTEFFGNSNYNKGTIHYNGQSYYGEAIKYDVYSDELLLKVKYKVGDLTIQLFKEQLQSFTLFNRNFIRIERNAAIGMDDSGFFELIVSNPLFTIYTKHKKNSYLRKDQSVLYYEFKEGKGKHYIFSKGEYRQIKSKKDLITIFPQLNKEINDFYISRRRLQRSKPNEFIAALANRMASLL